MDTILIKILILISALRSGCTDTCDCSQKTYQSKFYELCSCKKSWEEANQFCIESYGGHLASIQDEDTQSLLAGYLQTSFFEDTWVGARGIKDDWHWITGRVILKGQGCYKDEPSSLDLPYEIRLDDVTPELCISSCRRMSYRYAGVQGGYMCYCGNSFGRYGATSDCNTPCSANGNLYCGGYSKNYIYNVNGIEFTRWAFSEPNSGSVDDKECLTITCLSRDWEWKSERCSRRLKYLCEIDYSNGACPLSTAQINIPSINKCVLYEDSNFTTWFEASVRCKMNGGKLLEDINKDIHDALQAKLECWQDSFWVGASKVNWTWASGQEMVYSKWATATPTREGDKCVAMSYRLSSDYKWSDQACNQPLSFICQNREQIKVTTSTRRPTTTTTMTTTTTTPTTSTTTTTTPGPPPPVVTRERFTDTPSTSTTTASTSVSSSTLSSTSVSTPSNTRESTAPEIIVFPRPPPTTKITPIPSSDTTTIKTTTDKGTTTTTTRTTTESTVTMETTVPIFSSVSWSSSTLSPGAVTTDYSSYSTSRDTEQNTPSTHSQVSIETKSTVSFVPSSVSSVVSRDRSQSTAFTKPAVTIETKPIVPIVPSFPGTSSSLSPGIITSELSSVFVSSDPGQQTERPGEDVSPSGPSTITTMLQLSSNVPSGFSSGVPGGISVLTLSPPGGVTFAPSSDSTTQKEPAASGLTQGQKIGLGVGIGVGGFLVLLLILLILMRKTIKQKIKRHKQRKEWKKEYLESRQNSKTSGNGHVNDGFLQDDSLAYIDINRPEYYSSKIAPPKIINGYGKGDFVTGGPRHPLEFVPAEPDGRVVVELKDDQNRDPRVALDPDGGPTRSNDGGTIRSNLSTVIATDSDTQTITKDYDGYGSDYDLKQFDQPGFIEDFQGDEAKYIDPRDDKEEMYAPRLFEPTDAAGYISDNDVINSANIMDPGAHGTDILPRMIDEYQVPIHEYIQPQHDEYTSMQPGQIDETQFIGGPFTRTDDTMSNRTSLSTTTLPLSCAHDDTLSTVFNNDTYIPSFSNDAYISQDILDEEISTHL